MDAMNKTEVSAAGASAVNCHEVMPSPILKRHKSDCDSESEAVPAQKESTLVVNAVRTKHGKLTKKQSKYVPKSKSKKTANKNSSIVNWLKSSRQAQGLEVNDLPNMDATAAASEPAKVS